MPQDVTQVTETTIQECLWHPLWQETCLVSLLNGYSKIQIALLKTSL